MAITRIAILDDYQGVAATAAPWESLADCEVTAFGRHMAGEDTVAEALAEFDVVVAMRERTPFPASLLARLPRLKLLVTTGSRNAAIDMKAARAQGVPVSGTAMLGYPAAEHAWALVMALFKRTSEEDRAMHGGGWQVGFSDGLYGKTLGIMGLGRLGQRVARMGLAFEMKVIAWNPSLTDGEAAEHGVTRVDKDRLFAESDVLTLHVVLNDGTRGIVGAPELAAMKETAYLVNTSRGPVVDEAALIAALQRRTIAGAGIDVYDVEPLPAEHPLRRMGNAVLTGHTGYVTRENYRVAYGDAVVNVRAWLGGKPVNVVNGG